EQLQRLGASCDWSRTRFTLDEGLSRAVATVFVHLYEKGLIYRGERIVNWCPRCNTALSDLEAEGREIPGKLYWLRYLLKDSDKFITVVTTRPETMLGDTAVAVHPGDERYKELVGRTVILPILGREIPIVADEGVKSEVGSGAVKVTPAHDPLDFEIGERHGLSRVKVMDDRGVMNENAGKFAGQDRFECRKNVLQELNRTGNFLREEDHLHTVPHCQRCDTVIEPTVSRQWFVKMEPLARPALKSVRDGRVRFHPERFSKTYFDWLEQFRDWCISRQLWWGHRIPVYNCACGEVIVRVQPPKKCPRCKGTDLKQDQDVLDTWFSSALWPFSTLGWPKKTADLKRYYPTDTLSTARDIIYFWVARMIIQGLEFMDDVPFSSVLIHGTIQDEHGVRMSKSKGNGIDPIEMIDKFGADAVRFSLIQLTSEGQDIRLSASRFDGGKKLANKLWNASRFVLDQIGEPTATRASRPRREEDRWILSRLNSVTDRVETSLNAFRFHESTHLLYQFFWHEFCDWYVEIVKTRLREGPAADQRTARWVLVHVLDRTLRLLHPVMPFITEEIWQRLKGHLPKSERAVALAVASFPKPDRKLVDTSIERRMERVFGIVACIRNVRAEVGIPQGQSLEVVASVSTEAARKEVQEGADLLRRLARVHDLSVGVEMERPKNAVSKLVDGIHIAVPLKGLGEAGEAWKARQVAERAKLQVQLQSMEKKLSNPQFLRKAPSEVVDRLREHRDQLARSLSL
ncbi:MAG: valine--tRNA ligase, partial [Planctomycetota bacterium]|nr:valine--tRNA ligase [Planctomycetota bacterium]